MEIVYFLMENLFFPLLVAIIASIIIDKCKNKSSRRQMIISSTVLSHHRTYGSVYGGSTV